MNPLHVGPEIALVVGAVAVVLLGAFTAPDRQWLTTPVAMAAVVTSAGLTVGLAATTGDQLAMEGAWALDGVTQVAELVIVAVTLAVLALSPEWFRTDARRGEYPAVVLFSATGAMMLAGAADTMEMVVGMLLVSVTGYTLAAYHRASPAGTEAAMKYFLVGALTNTLLLLGVVLLFGLTATTNLAATAEALSGGGNTVALTAVVVTVVLGLGFELGAVPAHVWLPDVAQAAPAPSAAFLTAVPKVGAAVALARFVGVIPPEAVGWRPLVAVVAVVTMTLGNLLALHQDDVRRLLGWSSVSQAGYALVAVAVVGRSDLAVPALVVFLAGYAAANTAAFAVVTELRGRTDLADYHGLAARRPWLAATLALALLSLVGIPPLGGFVGKLTVFTAAIDGGYAWLAAAAVANTVVSLFYYLRVVAAAYLEAPPGLVAVLGRAAAVSAVGAGVATVAVGLAAEPILATLARSPFLP